MSHGAHLDQSTPEALSYYKAALSQLLDAGIPFLIGGGYCVHAYTGIARMTKDIDIFVVPENVDRTLEVFSRNGFQTEITYPHWLAKAYSGTHFIDVIFNSGNGCCPVDQDWFDYSTTAHVLGLPLKLCAVEETIWQKAFIMERERYDGADIAHLLRCRGAEINWNRLLDRFGQYWRVLFSHLVLFGFAYPGEQSTVPEWVIRELSERLLLERGMSPPEQPLCQGTLLSREQYLADILSGGYRDVRLRPTGMMSQDDIDRWTPKPAA